MYGKLMKTRDSNPYSLGHTDRQYTGTVYWYWYTVVLVTKMLTKFSINQ